MIRFFKINLNRKIYLKANMNFHIRLPPYYFSLSVVMIIALYIRMIAMVILDCILRFGETLFKQTNTAIALLRNIQWDVSLNWLKTRLTYFKTPCYKICPSKVLFWRRTYSYYMQTKFLWIMSVKTLKSSTRRGVLPSSTLFEAWIIVFSV